MHRALYVLLSHVPQCLWCLQGMIVHLGGPRSIMDTWWLHTMATRTSVTTYVLTRTQRLVQVRWQTKMVHYCSPWKVFVFHSRVIHMSPAESWPALYAPSNRRADSLACSQVGIIKPWGLDFRDFSDYFVKEKVFLLVVGIKGKNKWLSFINHSTCMFLLPCQQFASITSDFSPTLLTSCWTFLRPKPVPYRHWRSIFIIQLKLQA